MKYLIPLLMTCGVFSQYNGLHSPRRARRSAAGELHIVTNNEQPIHAEVQPEHTGSTEKVLPPTDSIYQEKSLRKSPIYISPVDEDMKMTAVTSLNSKLEIVRSINRMVTLAVLLLSAIAEFYPLFKYLYETICTLFN